MSRGDSGVIRERAERVKFLQNLWDFIKDTTAPEVCLV